MGRWPDRPVGRSGNRGPLREAWQILASAGADLPGLWKRLAAADLIYKGIAFVLLAPLASLLLQFQMARTGRSQAADTDILLFFLTTRPGFVALILLSALALAIFAVELAALMTLSLGARSGAPIRIPAALGHALGHAWRVLRLTLRIVARIFALAGPFLLAAGLASWGLLRGHDINFYLTVKPPVFWGAALLAGALLAAGAALLLPRCLGWVVALPVLLFEGVPPVRALRESGERLAGLRAAAGCALALWAGLGLGLNGAAWGICAGLGRAIAPALGGSLPLLLVFVAALALTWGAALLAIAVLSSSLLALLIVRLYERAGAPVRLRLPPGGDGRIRLGAAGRGISWRMALGGLGAALALATGAAYLALGAAWSDRPVLVIGHRGAGRLAPENTLAAFRRAIAARADLVELDVQESSDGVVLVVHDSDLMKVGRSPLKIWEAPAAALRQVDVGSHFSPEFRDERVPTLAEALALCKGKVRVDIELKSYGHNQRLEERVVELVEAAGVQGEIVTMSMNPGMVRRMKRLRPDWAAGILAAKALGNLAKAPADFVAVESKMATRRFVRKAHRAGKPVYVWTLNDPARMLGAIAVGADGLITDDPALGREVVDRHAALDPAQRLLVALLVRFGERGELLEPGGALRP